jgi:hypothetical protein
VKLPGSVDYICEDGKQTWREFKEFVEEMMYLLEKTFDELNLSSLLGSFLIRLRARNDIGNFVESEIFLCLFDCL